MKKVKWPSKSQVIGAIGGAVAVALQIPDVVAQLVALGVPLSPDVRHTIAVVGVVAAWLARSPLLHLSGLPGQEKGVQAVGVSAPASTDTGSESP